MIDDLFSIGSFTAKSLRRSILRYTRRPIDYNFERLPDPEQYQDMELAFLEDYFEPPQITRKHLWPYIKYTAYALIVLAACFFFGPGIILFLFIFLLFTAPNIFISKSRTLHQTHAQLSVGILLVIVLGAGFMLANLFRVTPLVMIVFGVPLVFLLRLLQADFVRFGTQWLGAHPCLSSAERREFLENEMPPTLKVAPLFSLLVVLILVSHFSSPFLNLLAIYAALAIAIAQGPMFGTATERQEYSWKEIATTSLKLLAGYLTYGRRFPKPLPGVMPSGWSHLVRRRLVVLTLLLQLIVIIAATTFFFAWDTPGFRGTFEDMFISTIYPHPEEWARAKTRMPWLDWSSILSYEEIEEKKKQMSVLERDLSVPDLDGNIARSAELTRLRQDVQANDQKLRVVASDWYHASADSWVTMAMIHTATHPVFGVICFSIAFLNALLIPPLFLFSILQKSLLELVRIHGALQSRVAAETTRSPWEWFVDRLRSSQHTAPDPANTETQIREADHLFLGVEATNGFPVLLHRPILNEHVYLSGGSGSGKTSLGILSLLSQLIRGGTENGPDNGDMPPIVIIDMKGEFALLHSVREEVRRKAEQEGRTLEDCFRLFTCEKGMPTHYFNPIGDMTYPDRYVADLANLLLDALELNHGPGYGRSYYSRKNYMLLHELLSNNNPENLDELCERIAKATSNNKDERHQAFELLATLYGLLEFDQLKPPKDVPESSMISMRKVVEERQVVYFWLPTVESSIIAREIANLALFSYFSAMRSRAKQRLPQRQSYLVVDEFQKLAGDRFSIILQQARGFGLSAILSNQSIADLKTPSYDLRSAINQNTRLKLYFSFSDCREMNDFAQRSGEELAYVRSGIYDLAGDGEPDAPLFNQWRHEVKSRVTTNDMLQVTDHPLQAFMDVRSGSGYTQFGGATLPLQMFHPIRWSEFQKRRDVLPWPTREELGLSSTTCSTVSPEEVDERATAELARLDERIRAFDRDNPHLRYS